MERFHLPFTQMSFQFIEWVPRRSACLQPGEWVGGHERIIDTVHLARAGCPGRGRRTCLPSPHAGTAARPPFDLVVSAAGGAQAAAMAGLGHVPGADAVIAAVQGTGRAPWDPSPEQDGKGGEERFCRHGNP